MRKILLSCIFAVVGMGIAWADDPIAGIIVTYDGAETSYKLEDVPTVKTVEKEGVKHAVIYLKDVAEPVLDVAIANGKSLIITPGEYVPTGIDGVTTDKATIVTKGGKKYVMGGKLIIVDKNGNKYGVGGEQL